MPLIVKVSDQGGEPGKGIPDWGLDPKSKGVGFVGPKVAVADPVLVALIRLSSGYKAMPKSRIAHSGQGRGLGIPIIEVADHAQMLGMGSPNRKVGSRRTRVSAQLLVSPDQVALVPEPLIKFS